MKRKQQSILRMNLFGIETAIVVAIIGAVGVIIAALIGYSASTYEARHPQVDDLEAGLTMKDITFEKASSAKTSQPASVKFSAAGNVYWSGYQSVGKNSSKYRVNYKKANVSTYNTGTAYTVKKGVWSSEHKLGYLAKKTKYNFTVTKTTNLKQKTKVTIDLLQQ